MRSTRRAVLATIPLSLAASGCIQQSQSQPKVVSSRISAVHDETFIYTVTVENPNPSKISTNLYVICQIGSEYQRVRSTPVELGATTTKAYDLQFDLPPSNVDGSKRTFRHDFRDD